MFAISVLVCLLLTYIFLRYWSGRDYRMKMSKINREPGIPFIGHSLRFGTDKTKIMKVFEHMWEYNNRDKFLIQFGPLEQVVITKPEDIEVILSSNTLIDKNFTYKFLEPWFGDGLVTSGGNKWRLHRKLLTPAFHFNILESNLKTFEKQGEALVNEILQNGDTDINIVEYTNQYSLYAISRTALDFDDSKDNTVDLYLKHTTIIKTLINSRIFSFWKFIEPIYQMLPEAHILKASLNFITSKNMEVINSKRREMKDLIKTVMSRDKPVENLTEDKDIISKKKPTFSEILLLSKMPNGLPLNNEEINEEVMTFMVAGHETVSSTAAFALYSMAMNPEVQKKVYEEQLAITNNDLQQPVTYKCIQEMNYLDRVIKETLRCYPPISFFGRKITTNTKLPDGTELPKDSSILIVPHLTHNDPAVHKDPHRFDPDRFLDNNNNPYGYIPFSAGPRNCIGQKLAKTILKCWLAVIIRKVELLPSSKPAPHLSIEVILKSLNGVHVRARMRQNKNEN